MKRLTEDRNNRLTGREAIDIAARDTKSVYQKLNRLYQLVPLSGLRDSPSYPLGVFPLFYFGKLVGYFDLRNNPWMWNFHLQERTTLMLSLQAHASTQERHALTDAKQAEMTVFREVAYIHAIRKPQPIILNGNHQGTWGSVLDSDLDR